jgi:hypothetical protein
LRSPRLLDLPLMWGSESAMRQHDTRQFAGSRRGE